jgi:prevent-host-death family protein
MPVDLVTGTKQANAACPIDLAVSSSYRSPDWSRGTRMPRTMTAAEFKAKCLEALDRVAATGEPIVVTKRGKPVAQLAPVARKPKTVGGFLKGRIKSGKDIISPIGVKWDASRS